MGRFNASEAEHYGGQGGAGFFSLKNDKDTAQVRFMYNTADDVDGYAVHEVEIEGGKRYVNCLRSYNQPLDDCPFCKARRPQIVKLIIPLYNIDEDKVQIWERGKKFYAKISSLCARYASGDDTLVSQVFEIERNGKPGSTQTTYEIYPIGRPDATSIDDLPENPDIIGGLVLDKSIEDMDFYVENGYFPPDGDDVPVRRRDRREEDDNLSFEENRRSARRTPAANRDRF